jgi:putative oxidoreductase
MKIVVLIARILLGLMFLVFGLNGFLHFIPGALPPGQAGQFIGVLFTSHYSDFVFAVQLIAGVLLLINQFVPLALVLLGPVIFNILVFHVTMQPGGLPPGILALILWCIVAYRFRYAFEPLFARKTTEA